MSNSNLLKNTSEPSFWRQWLQLMGLCSALVLSPTFLYFGVFARGGWCDHRLVNDAHFIFP